MADNTKMPPNQDQRQRTPQNKPGDVKPQKSGGGPAPSGAGPDRDRQGVNNPGRPAPEIDPDRARPDRNKPIPDKQVPGKIDDDDDMVDDGPTGPIDRE